MSHLIQPIYFGSPFFVTKCLDRGNAGVFPSGIMAYANWRTEMLVDSASHPGIILTEEDDRIDYDNEPNTAVIFAVSCVSGFHISFESVGGIGANDIWTEATVSIIQGGVVTDSLGPVRLFADPSVGSTFQQLTTSLQGTPCGTFIEISFINAPDSDGVQLECFFNGISEFY